MAKKQSNIGLFERAGYALGASNLKMEHHDYVKSLREDFKVAKANKKELEKENPNGLPVEKMSGNNIADSTEYILGLSDEIKRLSSINEGDTYVDEVTGETVTYDIRDIRDQIDKLTGRVENHNTHLESKAGHITSQMDRGEPSKASSQESHNNWMYLTSKNFGKDGLKEQLNTETGEYEWYDYTVGKHVPISKFNTGSAYDPTLGRNFDNTLNQLNEIKNLKAVKDDPTQWKSRYKEPMIREVKNYLEENPTAAKNVIFEDDDFMPALDNYLYDYYSTYQEEVFDSEADFNTWKNSDAGKASIEDLKKEDINIDFFMDSYSLMLDNKFNENFVPTPEEVVDEINPFDQLVTKE